MNTASTVEKVINTIKERKLLYRGEHIVIGVSGGPDSVCLLCVLNRMAGEFDWTLHGVHVNHMLRGELADRDQKYTEDLCRSMGIECTSYVIDVPRLAGELSMSFEEAGRKARYDAFYEVRDKLLAQGAQAVKIAVAQNKNDQAETVLMRILRGTGTDGLAAVEYNRDDVVIRPLLDVTREQIEAFNREAGLVPQIDHTNQDCQYVRNRIRLELIPYLEENFNANITDTLYRLASIAREDKSYFKFIIEEFLSAHGGTIKKLINGEEADVYALPLDEVQKLKPAVRKRLINRSIQLLGLDQDVGKNHIESADQAILKGSHNCVIQFPQYGVMEISRNQLLFYINHINGAKDGNASGGCLPAGQASMTPDTVPGRLKKNLLRREQVSDMGSSKEYVQYFDEAALSDRKLVLRYRQPGDYIIPLGMKGRKKIQDLFVDLKIDKEKRDQIPLVCTGSEVVWAVGYRTSETYKVKPGTKTILCLEYLPTL